MSQRIGKYGMDHLYELFHVFIKFAVVGVINTGLSFAIYKLLMKVGLKYRIANVISYVIGLISSFILNKNFTFQNKGDIPFQAFKFVIVFIPCFFVQQKVLQICVEKFKLGKSISWAIATGVYLVLNFLGHRFITFAN